MDPINLQDLPNPPTSPNGASGRPAAAGRDLASSIEERFKIFRVPLDSETMADEGAVEESENDVPVVVTSMPAQHFFRVDGREGRQMRLPVLKVRDSRVLYLAATTVRRSDIRDYSAFLARTHVGKLMLWCIPRPGPSGNDYPAWQQMRKLARQAMTCWCAMRWEEQPSGRFLLKAKQFPQMKDPVVFPDTDIRELVLQAFGERTIERADDPRLLAIPDLTDAAEL